MRPQRYLVLVTFLLATLSAVSGQTSADSFRFDPPPGSYPRSIDVSLVTGSSVDSSKPIDDVDAPRLWYRFAEDSDSSFIPAGERIPLSAIPGGALDYTVELATGEPGRQEVVATAQYRIDAEAPPPPMPDPVPGVHVGAVDLKLRSEEGSSIRYLFAKSASEPQRYSGPVRLDSPAGERSEYTVIAVAEDAAGNLSEVFEGRYVVDRSETAEGGVELQIRSPVSGEFANRQLLVVESSGLSAIHYTTDGSRPYASEGESQPSPGSSSTLYAGPVLIEKTGTYTVTVAGLDASGTVYERSVTVTAGGKGLLTLEQGVIAEDRQVPAPEARAYFTTDERTPTRADRLLSEAIRLSPSAGVVRTVVFRVLIAEGSGASAGEYRYVYVLEGRTPAQPEAIVHRSAGTDSPLHVSLLSSPGAAISYTLDGSDPARGRLYRGGFAPSLPSGEEAGSLELRAVARYSGTVESKPLVLDIPYDTAAPPAPSIETLGSGRGRQVTLRIDGGSDGKFVYTFGDTASRWSHPLEGDRLSLSAPEGSDRTLQASVARVDESGNLSSPSGPVELRLDGKPPPPPAVSVEGRRVSLEGENVRFRLKPDTVSEATADPTDTGFESYESPIFLTAHPNGRIVYDLRAFSEDEHGNASELTQRRVVADTRTPGLPANLGVKDGVSYGSAVTIRNESQEPDLQLRYRATFSDGEEPPPEDPGAPSAQQVVGSGLTLDAPENTERRYRLAVQPVFTSSERSGEVSHFEFTVDRRPPDVPKILGIADGETYGHSVSFLVEAESESDRAEYALVAEDGAAVEEPATGLDWRHASDEVRVDVPAGEQKRFTLRARSVDPAGNVTAREEAVKFRIDRAAPSPPGIRVEGARPIAADGAVNHDASDSAGVSTVSPTSPTRFVGGERVRVILSSEEGTVHYGLRGDDAPAADAVSSNDTRYDAPIVLETEEGAERSYVLQAISVDSVGNESAPSKEVRIVLDRRAPSMPELVSVYTDDSGRGGTAVWRHGQGTFVRYRVAHESVSAQAFQSTERIGRWELPSGATRAEIEFFAEDVAGNRSARDSVAVRGFSAAPEPRLAGVEDGAVYGEAVVVQNRTETGTVRYEVTTDGSTPGDV
ncbi:MAG: hypothetical protein GVY29_12835, partial [Spirochaetes bacterium]|nr:hypothetical protein [Spirochaetota bacterium]